MKHTPVTRRFLLWVRDSLVKPPPPTPPPPKKKRERALLNIRHNQTLSAPFRGVPLLPECLFFGFRLLCYLFIKFPFSSAFFQSRFHEKVRPDTNGIIINFWETAHQNKHTCYPYSAKEHLFAPLLSKLVTREIKSRSQGVRSSEGLYCIREYT